MHFALCTESNKLARCLTLIEPRHEKPDFVYAKKAQISCAIPFTF